MTGPGSGKIKTMNNNKNGKPLRSTHWFGLQDRDGFIHRSWMKNQGFPSNLFDGRPVIGICNTWSELTPCNAHFRMIADRVKRGVYEAGGFPAGVSRDVAGGNQHAADRHALPQPGEHGRGGIDPGQSHRWSGPAVRLRQDHAFADDGRGQLRFAGAGGFGRGHAQRPLPRRDDRVGHQRVVR